MQSSGYQVVTWTVNSPARMSELLELGVNGISFRVHHFARQAASPIAP